MKKKVFISLIALGLPIVAAAAIPPTPELIIYNNTSHDSTCVLNHGACSTVLPNGVGISKAHLKNPVPGKAIDAGCIFGKKNCLAEVHMTNDCSGPIVAYVYIDLVTIKKDNTKVGIYAVQPSATSGGYVITGSGFVASIDGGPPSTKNWFQRIFGF